MSNLVDFAKRIKVQLNAADREPYWGPDEAEQYMSAMEARRERFERLSTQLNEAVIQPRVETLAGYFPNASLVRDEPAGHCSCWFGYTERFPSTTKVSFVVEHDVRFEKVAVCYETWMTPVFIKFNERDKLTSPLFDLKVDQVSTWVEERLLEFLDLYLQIDRGGDDLDEDAATDPVCGMRISRSAAAASDSHLGHPYFFCSRECQERFAREPTAYVEVKAI